MGSKMTIQRTDSDAIVEDEWYAVRYSGEIPEVALQSALHHLSEDPEGPKLKLTRTQHAYLLGAATQRYLDIVLRDLLPENIHTTAYRGIQRSFVNWQRFQLFCKRYELDGSMFRNEVGTSLLSFLKQEVSEVQQGAKSCINCSHEELVRYAKQLDLDATKILDEIADYCC